MKTSWLSLALLLGLSAGCCLEAKTAPLNTRTVRKHRGGSAKLPEHLSQAEAGKKASNMVEETVKVATPEGETEPDVTATAGLLVGEVKMLSQENASITVQKELGSQGLQKVVELVDDASSTDASSSHSEAGLSAADLKKQAKDGTLTQGKVQAQLPSFWSKNKKKLVAGAIVALAIAAAFGVYKAERVTDPNDKSYYAAIMDKLVGLREGAVSYTGSATNAVKGAYDAATWDNIKAASSAAAENVSSATSNAWTATSGAVTGAAGSLRNNLYGFWLRVTGSEPAPNYDQPAGPNESTEKSWDNYFTNRGPFRTEANSDERAKRAEKDSEHMVRTWPKNKEGRVLNPYGSGEPQQD